MPQIPRRGASIAANDFGRAASRVLGRSLRGFPIYSFRHATGGSTRAARRAGAPRGASGADGGSGFTRRVRAGIFSRAASAALRGPAGGARRRRRAGGARRPLRRRGKSRPPRRARGGSTGSGRGKWRRWVSREHELGRGGGAGAGKQGASPKEPAGRTDRCRPDRSGGGRAVAGEDGGADRLKD